jgi:hypothetical protein
LICCVWSFVVASHTLHQYGFFCIIVLHLDLLSLSSLLLWPTSQVFSFLVYLRGYLLFSFSFLSIVCDFLLLQVTCSINIISHVVHCCGSNSLLLQPLSLCNKQVCSFLVVVVYSYKSRASFVMVVYSCKLCIPLLGLQQTYLFFPCCGCLLLQVAHFVIIGL